MSFSFFVGGKEERKIMVDYWHGKKRERGRTCLPVFSRLSIWEAGLSGRALVRERKEVFQRGQARKKKRDTVGKGGVSLIARGRHAFLFLQPRKENGKEKKTAIGTSANKGGEREEKVALSASSSPFNFLWKRKSPFQYSRWEKGKGKGRIQNQRYGLP